MKIGFLFPGQGSQNIGMGKDLYEKYEEVRRVYKQVEAITGIDVAAITFNGEEEILNQTKNTQICILTMSLAILKLLEQYGIKADVSSGLSLGEYTALIYSKALEWEEGIKLVQKRGEYMQNLVPEGNWSMAAVLGLADSQVDELCSKVQKGFVVPVNYNCPGQVVVSGDEDGVEEVEKLAKEAGAKKVRILKTSGPFHTEKLTEASKHLQNELQKITFHPFETQVVKNIDGKLYNVQDNIQNILAKHIISPVRFSKGLKTMLDMRIDTFIEIGPGKTLAGFVKRMPTDKEINTFSIQNVESLEEVINKLK